MSNPLQMRLPSGQCTPLQEPVGEPLQASRAFREIVERLVQQHVIEMSVLAMRVQSEAGFKRLLERLLESFKGLLEGF